MDVRVALPAVGSAVTVASFGSHPGRVTGHDPVVTIQGRRRRAEGWVSVTLDDGRPWDGDAALALPRGE